MKLQSNFNNKFRAGLLACAGIALTLGVAVTHAKADAWNKKTVMTIDHPMQVMDNYLEPGTYVFRLLDSQSDRHIVQIYNADENHLIATILAIPDYRVQVTGKPVFRMWETPAGYTPALRSWYYPGDNFGQEFPYPKSLRQVTVAQNQTTTTTTETAQAEPTPPPAPVAAPQQEVQQQETVIAQNTEPAQPEAQQQQETPATAPAPAPPATLPQTASPYPLIGLIGALLIGAGGVLRQTRSA